MAGQVASALCVPHTYQSLLHSSSANAGQLCGGWQPLGQLHTAPRVVQAERISQLEAQRSQLLAQLPEDVQSHVLRRQQDAVEEEGGVAGNMCT